jgi:2-keto-4-pentenoate hydratase
MVDTAALAREIHDACQAQAPLPAPSQRGAELSLAEAYDVQAALVALRAGTDPIAGYKAALTAPAAQRAMGVAEPVSGVLFASGRLHDGVVVAARPNRTLLLETEIGFLLNGPIEQPLADVPDLRTRVRWCLPVVELAEIGFGKAAASGTDLVAANAASGRFLYDPEMARSMVRQAVDVDAVEVSLARDGELLQRSAAGDVPGGQWQALLWLVNALVVRGRRIGPEDLLITGAVGAVQPGRPGRYVADFGELGRLGFEICG